MSQQINTEEMELINKALEEQEQVSVKMRKWLKLEAEKQAKKRSIKTADYISAAVAEKLIKEEVLPHKTEG